MRDARMMIFNAAFLSDILAPEPFLTAAQGCPAFSGALGEIWIWFFLPYVQMILPPEIFDKMSIFSLWI